MVQRLKECDFPVTSTTNIVVTSLLDLNTILISTSGRLNSTILKQGQLNNNTPKKRYKTEKREFLYHAWSYHQSLPKAIFSLIVLHFYFSLELPQEFCLVITREMGDDDWQLDQLLDIFKRELEARERAGGSTVKTKTKTMGRWDYTCLVNWW